MKQKFNLMADLQEWSILTAQYLQIMFSDIKNVILMIAFPLAAALITVWLAGKNMYVHFEGAKSGCFVVVSAAIWGGLFNSIQIVVKERANIKRDYIAGVKMRNYTGSRVILQLLLCLVQSAILCAAFVGANLIYDGTMQESGIIFGNTVIEYYFSCFFLMFAADSMGLLISCIVKKVETANTMAPYILIVQLIFSGILFKMEGASEYVSYLMLSRWGMEAFGITGDFNSLSSQIVVEQPELGRYIASTAQDMYNRGAGHLLRVWLILIAFSIVFIVIGNMALHSVSKDSR